VVNALLRDPFLSGRIGVETDRSEVTMNGFVGTPGQIERAGRDAKRVDSVMDVRNYLRARVGGSP
jgi:osmotically-inducible protein OsmY